MKLKVHYLCISIEDGALLAFRSRTKLRGYKVKTINNLDANCCLTKLPMTEKHKFIRFQIPFNEFGS